MDILLVTALLPCIPPYSLEPEGKEIPYTVVNLLHNSVRLYEKDLAFHEQRYTDARKRGDAVEARMRAFHIRRTKSYLLGLSSTLNQFSTQPVSDERS